MNRFLLVIGLLFGAVSSLWAQVSIMSPQARMVFQRNLQNEASVPISGLCPANATRVEARFEIIPGGGGTSTNWIQIDGNPQNGTFQGNLTARGGWYRLFVRVLAGNANIGEAVLDRVGVGEVFIIAGQSNASGGLQPTPGASDDRVSVVDYADGDLTESRFPLVFSKADAGRSVGPFNPLYIWGMLGDRLVKRLNVPVLFYGAAYGGTNSEVWKISANGQNPGGQPGELLMPYRCIGAVLEHYTRRTGVRAVLWHQGESDNGYRGEQAYFDNVKTVIDKSRQESGFSRLPWVVSRVSYIGGTTDQNIINGQNKLIREVDQVWPGPETDPLIGPDNRFDGLHFGGQGLIRLTDLWEKCLTENFFAQSAPGTVSGAPAVITTGYVLPLNQQQAGQAISVPYLRSNIGFRDGNQFSVQLLKDGGLVQELGTGTGNPLRVNLPGNIQTGQYQVRVLSTNPAYTGSVSPLFSANGVAPNTGGGGSTTTGQIQQISYKYDAPTHGFDVFVQADGSTEVKLERLDGAFSASGWFPMVSGSYSGGFNYTRFYAPAAVGVGGVESGQYRLTVQRTGQSSTAQSFVFSPANGTWKLYPTTDTGTGSTGGSTTTPPSSTTTTVPNNVETVAIRKIGYKYDVPTHGFQLLVDASTAVEVRLERLDGTFSPSDWGTAQSYTNESGYGYQRFYAPVAPGVGGVEAGRYRLSARIAGQPSTAVGVEVVLQYGIFPVYTSAGSSGTTSSGGGSTTTPPTTTPPTTTTTTPPTTVAGIRKLGYKYDAPTNGLQVLVDADGNVQIKIERLDGTFSPSDWGTAQSYTNESGYNLQRFYPPVSPGVGGAVSGRYRLSARLADNPSTEVSVEVALQWGVFGIYPVPTVAKSNTIDSETIQRQFYIPTFVIPGNQLGCSGCIPLDVQRIR
ncbi:sialate O-acetylesterase [Arsenicibacter rosenii]|uniref:Sialate O-acetylesterase domain-containing protein n=1 Tax=Arsenicibacter rosenii TaxID=1750698 RepID=A0A1S2VPF9_9BACT|nr:sialate O-acetylesterase [Arsenicibacter rosenii]OIN59678.1 hypothetical protein BLX24_07360 [Arsenicibacter rosenii]